MSSGTSSRREHGVAWRMAASQRRHKQNAKNKAARQASGMPASWQHQRIIYGA